jgi:hypothetical protein
MAARDSGQLCARPQSHLRSNNVWSKAGFQEGDEVWVESWGDKTQGKVHLTELMHPEVTASAGTLDPRD